MIKIVVIVMVNFKNDCDENNRILGVKVVMKNYDVVKFIVMLIIMIIMIKMT